MQKHELSAVNIQQFNIQTRSVGKLLQNLNWWHI